LSAIEPVTGTPVNPLSVFAVPLARSMVANAESQRVSP